MSALAPLLISAALLALGFIAGRLLERRHLVELGQREAACRHMPTVTMRQLPGRQEIVRSELVMGSTVVSHDYFKRFSAGLKAIVGGPLRAYEPLLERARREALQRLREDARRKGHHAVVRVRLQTATVASMQGGRGLGAVEVLAYGTALTLAQPHSALSSPTGAPTALRTT